MLVMYETVFQMEAPSCDFCWKSEDNKQLSLLIFLHETVSVLQLSIFIIYLSLQAILP